MYVIWNYLCLNLELPLLKFGIIFASFWNYLRFILELSSRVYVLNNLDISSLNREREIKFKMRNTCNYIQSNYSK